MARFHIKTATLTFGSTAFEMASGPAASGKGQTRDAVEVTALSDTFKQFIQGALTEDDEFTVSLYDKGTGMPTVNDTPAALTLAVTLSNGVDNDVSANVAYTKAIVTKVAPPSQDGGGDRKATVDVTFRPTGEQPVAQTSGSGTSTP